MNIKNKEQINFFNILNVVKELFVKTENVSEITETVTLEEVASLQIEKGVIIKINKKVI